MNTVGKVLTVSPLRRFIVNNKITNISTRLGSAIPGLVLGNLASEHLLGQSDPAESDTKTIARAGLPILGAFLSQAAMMRVLKAGLGKLPNK